MGFNGTLRRPGLHYSGSSSQEPPLGAYGKSQHDGVVGDPMTDSMAISRGDRVA